MPLRAYYSFRDRAEQEALSTAAEVVMQERACPFSGFIFAFRVVTRCSTARTRRRFPAPTLARIGDQSQALTLIFQQKVVFTRQLPSRSSDSMIGFFIRFGILINYPRPMIVGQSQSEFRVILFAVEFRQRDRQTMMRPHIS